MLSSARRTIMPAALLALIPIAAHAGNELDLRFLDETVEGEYSILCPIVIEGKGEFRIGFDATDSGDLSWVRIANGKATLHRQVDGSQKRVGPAARLGATGPAELTLQRRADCVRVIVAGEVALNVPWDAPLGGRVGVASSDSYVAGKPMVQPVDPPFVTDDFTREAEAMGNWETSGGSFANTMVSATGADANLSANPFSLHVMAEDAAATTGYWFWDSYRAGLSVKPVETAAVALRGWVQDDANYLALRWQAGGPREPAARRLVLVRDGREQTLAKAPGGFEPGEWYRLELRLTPGHVEALIDREPVLSAKTNALGQGAVGLSLAAGDAYFDDLLVASLDHRDDWPPRINPVFLADPVMTAEEVFVPSGFWRAGEAAGQYWHWGEFFDDALVTVPADLLTGDGLGVLLRSDGADVGAGYRVDASLTDGKLALALSRNGAPVTSDSAAMEEEDPLAIEVRGGTLEVRSSGRTLLRHVDPEPLSGHRVALVDAPEAAVHVVSVLSDQFRDYVFDRSPTDWFAGKGDWSVTTRWPCEPGWTFYGGTGVENPVAWTKHTYRGDMVLEWFGAIQSDNIDRIRYVHPSDINTTICGDGRSLRSGYSFILGGWDNTKTAMLRNGEIVAETADVVLPDPNSRDLAAHRGWSRIRIEKFGNHISMYYENKLVLEYTDPDPLPGGRVGLWSFHNELVAGRVRLWYADEGPPSVGRKPEMRLTELMPTERPADASGVFNDFEQDSGEWQPLDDGPVLLELASGGASGHGTSLRVTNQDEGGPFAVAAVTTPFEVGQWPQLSFDYRLNPDVRVNIYVMFDDRWHAVKLTAEQPPGDDVPFIAEVPDVIADGKWHHAQVSLLESLQAMYEGFIPSTIDRIVFSPPWESYAWCGIGGNGYGATYWIDNFRIGPAE